MKNLIRKCVDCGKYTMEVTCRKCGGITHSTDPLKYSPSDKFQKFRLKEKEAENYGENRSK